MATASKRQKKETATNRKRVFSYKYINFKKKVFVFKTTRIIKINATTCHF